MQIRNKIIILVAVIAVVIVIASFAGYYFYYVNWPASDKSLEKEFVIMKGEGVNEISRNLKRSGLIGSSLVFETYLWLHDQEGNLKAGSYDLQTNLSIKELTDHLIGGVIDNEIKIKIIEGWDNRDIAEYLSKNNVAARDDFMEKTKNRGDLHNQYDFLKGSITLEGYLFPDTYRVFTDSTVEQIINKMLANFDKKLSEKMREDIKNQGKSVYEIMTLASIIEKEVQTAEDKRMAADVFYKRLEIDMQLQSDATVGYVTGKNATRASYEDIRVDSLYNTYKYKGLPPGPICNPGLDSIMGAIYPKSNDYWFFLTTEENEVIYSKTAEEHSENKAKYLD